jgi:hypothetical protein
VVTIGVRGAKDGYSSPPDSRVGQAAGSGEGRHGGGNVGLILPFPRQVIKRRDMRISIETRRKAASKSRGRDAEMPAVRPMLGGLKLLDRFLLFSDSGDPHRPALAKPSRDAQALVSTAPAELARVGQHRVRAWQLVQGSPGNFHRCRNEEAAGFGAPAD